MAVAIIHFGKKELMFIITADRISQSQSLSPGLTLDGPGQL